MKGIILAGGSGTRLHPLTYVVSKQLMPVYDKPMIYYPLSILMMANIQEVLIISTPADLPLFEKLLGDGAMIGMKFSYAVQAEPKGLAQAFTIGASFIGDDNVALILGDNIFYGTNLETTLIQAKTKVEKEGGGTVFGYHVAHPEHYGVVSFDDNGKVMDIQEKPKFPQSNYAVPGLYFYDNQVVNIAQNLQPSQRGELEITDVNKAYLKQNQLHVELLSRGTAWLDTGTHESLLDAAIFVQIVEKRQGLKVGCIEELAFRKGFISKEQLRRIAEPLKKSGYGHYLMTLCE